jgi:hypothetical protein
VQGLCEPAGDFANIAESDLSRRCRDVRGLRSTSSSFLPSGERFDAGFITFDSHVG